MASKIHSFLVQAFLVLGGHLFEVFLEALRFLGCQRGPVLVQKSTSTTFVCLRCRPELAVWKGPGERLKKGVQNRPFEMQIIRARGRRGEGGALALAPRR